MTAPTRRTSRPRSAKVSPFWWFQGDSVREITARLNANPDGRLVVRLKGKKMTLDVEGDVSTHIHVPGHTPVNESHLCPPDCGD